MKISAFNRFCIPVESRILLLHFPIVIYLCWISFDVKSGDESVL